MSVSEPNKVRPTTPGSGQSTFPLPKINLWDKPEATRETASIVGSIPRGTPVEILEERPTGWKRVRTKAGRRLEGWVHQTFLQH